MRCSILLEPSPSEVSIYDLTGGRVRRLNSVEVQNGRVQLQWDGRGDDDRLVPPGIYLAVVKIRSDRETERRFNSVSVVYYGVSQVRRGILHKRYLIVVGAVLCVLSWSAPTLVGAQAYDSRMGRVKQGGKVDFSPQGPGGTIRCAGSGSAQMVRPPRTVQGVPVETVGVLQLRPRALSALCGHRVGRRFLLRFLRQSSHPRLVDLRLAARSPPAVRQQYPQNQPFQPMVQQSSRLLGITRDNTTTASRLAMRSALR